MYSYYNVMSQVRSCTLSIHVSTSALCIRKHLITTTSSTTSDTFAFFVSIVIKGHWQKLNKNNKNTTMTASMARLCSAEVN